MVGGKVVRTLVESERVVVVVRDNMDKELAVYVEPEENARCVLEGDAVWWQSDKVFWTPRHTKDALEDGKIGVDFDIPLKRIGYSHEPRERSVREDPYPNNKQVDAVLIADPLLTFLARSSMADQEVLGMVKDRLTDYLVRAADEQEEKDFVRAALIFIDYQTKEG